LHVLKRRRPKLVREIARVVVASLAQQGERARTIAGDLLDRARVHQPGVAVVAMTAASRRQFRVQHRQRQIVPAALVQMVSQVVSEPAQGTCLGSLPFEPVEQRQCFLELRSDARRVVPRQRSRA
jgi:hypothetical protein